MVTLVCEDRHVFRCPLTRSHPDKDSKAILTVSHLQSPTKLDTLCLVSFNVCKRCKFQPLEFLHDFLNRSTLTEVNCNRIDISFKSFPFHTLLQCESTKGTGFEATLLGSVNPNQECNNFLQGLVFEDGVKGFVPRRFQSQDIARMFVINRQVNKVTSSTMRNEMMPGDSLSTTHQVRLTSMSFNLHKILLSMNA